MQCLWELFRSTRGLNASARPFRFERYLVHNFTQIRRARRLAQKGHFLENGFAFKITPASVNAILTRASKASEKEYGMLRQKIRTALKVYCDETSFSFMGKKFWEWVFRTDADILLVIRHSRAHDVLFEVLGKDFKKTLISDCHGAYNFMKLAHIQRCWTHLLRKAKEACRRRAGNGWKNSAAGMRFYHELRLLFARIKRFNATPRTMQQRECKYDILTRDLEKLVRKYSKNPQTRGVAQCVGKRVGQWITCVFVENVEPTNNFAEQAIRETVLVRKIIGAFRSVSGAQVYETLASLLATWQLQKKDVTVELRRVLAAGLC